MPVTNIRIAPVAGDGSAAAQPDGAAPVEIFGEIISGLAETSGEGTLETPAPVAIEVVEPEAAAPSGEYDVAKTVEQLLALAPSRPVEAKPTELSADAAETLVGSEDLKAITEVSVPHPIAAAQVPSIPVAPNPPAVVKTEASTPLSFAAAPKPQSLPASEQQPLQQPQASQSAQVEASPDVAPTQAPADAPQPATAEARIAAPKAAPSVREPQAPSLPTAERSPVEAPQIASPRTQSVVQLAFSNLEAAVKALPAQAWAAPAPARTKRSGDTEPTVALPELKLTTAMALPSINPAAAVSAPTGPADAVQIGTNPAPQPLDPTELVIEHQLDMAHEGEWLDQLARDIAQSAGSDSSPLRFRLNPENLGSLRVEITQDRNGAAVRLTADTEAARAIIADAQPRLIAEARAQGIRISEAHVDLGGQTASGDPRRQNAAFEETPLRTARSLQDQGEGDGKPTPGRSERYA